MGRKGLGIELKSSYFKQAYLNCENAIEEKAKECKRRYEHKFEPRKPVKRERKVDEDKKELLTIIEQAISNVCSIEEIVNETEIKFSYNGNSYSIKMTKHRNK